MNTTSSSGETSQDADSSESIELPGCAGTEPYLGEKAEVTVVTNSGPHAAPYVLWADRMGCFEAHGIEVDLVQAGAPSDRIAALVSQDADVVWLPSEPLLAGVINAGLDMVIVAQHAGFSKEMLDEAKRTETFNGSLILDGAVLAAPASEMRTRQDLDGARIGRQSAVSNIGVEIALADAQVDLDTVEWVDLEQSERLNGLLRGDLDVAALSGIYALKAIRGGAHFLFYYQAWEREPGAQNFWVTSSEVAANKESELMRFRDAMWDSYRLLGSDETEREFWQFTVELLEGDSQDAEAISLPDFAVQPVSVEELELHMSMMLERGAIDNLVDLRDTSLFFFGTS